MACDADRRAPRGRREPSWGPRGRGAPAPASGRGARAARRRPANGWRGWLAAILAGVLALLGGLVAGGAGARVVADTTPAAEPEPARVLGDVRPQPADPVAAEAYRSCSITSQTNAPGALEFHGSAIDAATGEVLFEQRADDANPTASVLKLLTTTAALQVLGPDYRIPTRVYQGAERGEIVVVGGGDVTLNALAPGIPSYYAGATAFLSDLAQQTKDAWAADPSHAGVPITSIRIDDSLFEGDWHATWSDKDRTDGYVSHITAFQVSGDRQTATAKVSPRGEGPSLAAGRAFATAMGLGPEAVSVNGTAPEGAPKLAEVLSQPVSELVGYVIRDSDNSLAESLARLTAIKAGTGDTFEAIHPAVTTALENLGLDITGVKLADGSGLSRDNRVPPRFVVSLLTALRSGSSNLQPVLDALPASHMTGSLEDRLGQIPPGVIRAKTGWIDEVYGLAGFAHGEDGSEITFAFFVVGRVDPTNRDHLDAIAATVYGCGLRLAGW